MLIRTQHLPLPALSAAHTHRARLWLKMTSRLYRIGQLWATRAPPTDLRPDARDLTRRPGRLRAARWR
jgi:hypothetical protein